MAKFNPSIPRLSQLSDSSIPLSFTFQNKQLALSNRIRSRLRALKYHYDRLENFDHDLYFDSVKKLSSALYLLDNTNFICNTSYLSALRTFKSLPSSNDEHIKNIFSGYIPRISKVERTFNDTKRDLNFAKKLNKNVSKYQELHNTADSRLKMYKQFKNKLRLDCLAQRRSVLKKRVRYAIAEAAHNNWYLVFGTLTVDDKHMEQVTSLDSSVWTDYIRSVDRAVGISIHGTWRNAINARISGNDFHKYFAVVEYGTKTHRYHLHVIHMMKQLPFGCSDPNLGLIQPINYNIDRFRAFWPYGANSCWTPMRYSNSDSFSQINWRWPVKYVSRGTYKPIQLGSPLKVANYICKYINKSYAEDQQKGELKWRTKMSRNLGLTPLKLLINQMSRPQLYRQMLNPSTLNLLNQRIPTTMYRRLCFRQWLNLKSSMTSIIRKMSVLNRLEPRENILKSFVNSVETTHEYNPESFGNTEMKNIPNMDTFNLQNKLNIIEKQLFGDNINQSPPCNAGGFTGARYYG